MTTEYDLTKFDKVMSDVKDIQEKGNFLPSCTTKEGYEASKRFVLDITTPARKALESVHKEVKKPFWDACKMLDGKKKELMPILESIEEPHKLAYKAVDQEKKDKALKFEQDLDAKVNALFNFRNMVFGKSSEELSLLIGECGEVDTQKGFYHRAKDAAQARAESLDALNDALLEAVKMEAQAKEQARVEEEQRIERERLYQEQEDFRRQQEEFAVKQAEAQREVDEKESQRVALVNKEAEEVRLKQEFELKAQREAEEEERRIEHEKSMSDLKIKRDAELKAEGERLEAERIEQENKLRTGRTKNRNVAAKVLIDDFGIDKDVAVKIMNHIASSKIPFVQSNF